MFVRLLFAQHFKENFDIASTSLHEDSAVFGGHQRIQDGVMTLARRYPNAARHPGHHHLLDGGHRRRRRRQHQRLQQDAQAGVPGPQGLCRSGPHAELQEQPGRRLFRMRAVRLQDHRQGKVAPTGKLNIFPGWVNPGDVVLLKRYLREMGVDATIFMDTEDFDSPMLPDKSIHTHGRTTVEDISRIDGRDRLASRSRATKGASAADYLQKRVRRSGPYRADALWHRQHRRHAAQDLARSPASRSRIRSSRSAASPSTPCRISRICSSPTSGSLCSGIPIW